ncbi:NIPSNAP1 [Branchiostoma lanceolatum]|uniref:NIPSNAP1 protein n=2 Tax=Branchiostoma lanceolatum TaxID=7740 RepID=A0A8J9WDJ4_BRALA|nr:NIPSNAP1 [Branchiostoma lanceolatum]
MAATMGRLTSVLRQQANSTVCRPLFTSTAVHDDKPEGGKNWFTKLFPEKIQAPTDAHSRLLTAKDLVYEMQIHDVKPEYMEQYKEMTEEYYPRIHESSEFPGEVKGSWYTAFGYQDQAVHLWIYRDGYDGVTRSEEALLGDKEMRGFVEKRQNMLRARSNQLLLEFSFWGEPQPREGFNVYEMRSYQLKPGTMIEWGNNWAKAVPTRRGYTEREVNDLKKQHGADWARGIQHRQENSEAVGGFFSQIGPLYCVHHLWAYKDLQARKATRESAWRKPGWDQCVSYTVPLIRKMESRVMHPAPFSPLQ